MPLPGIGHNRPPLTKTKTVIGGGVGTSLGDLTDGAGVAAAFNGVSNADATNSAAKNTSTSGYVNNIGKSWSSVKWLGAFDLYGPNNSNPFGGGGALTFKLQGSDGVTWYDIQSGVLPTGASSVLNVNNLPEVYYIGHRLIFLGNGTNSIFVTELVFYEML